MSTEKAILERRLSEKLARKSHDIVESIKHIERTGQNLNDFLIPTRSLHFTNNNEVEITWPEPQSLEGTQHFKLHDNAVYQLATRFGINARDLRREASGSEWERKVFADRLNAYTQNVPKKNFLVRTVNDTAKAVLSDKYKRLNTAAIFMAFLTAAQKAGSVLVDANHGELRDFAEVILPRVVEIPTEKNGIVFTVFGAQIRNSDFGASLLELRIFQMNVVCLNGMVSQSMIKEKHLGSRIEETGAITFAQETVEADTKARALMVRDIMDSVYSEENLTRERERIQEASTIELDFQNEVKALPKTGMLQGEVEMLNKALYESDPENGLQGKNTLWKLAQGITHVANEVESADRKRDLQDIASGMMANFVK